MARGADMTEGRLARPIQHAVFYFLRLGEGVPMALGGAWFAFPSATPYDNNSLDYGSADQHFVIFDAAVHDPGYTHQLSNAPKHVAMDGNKTLSRAITNCETPLKRRGTGRPKGTASKSKNRRAASKATDGTAAIKPASCCATVSTAIAKKDSSGRRTEGIFGVVDASARPIKVMRVLEMLNAEREQDCANYFENEKRRGTRIGRVYYDCACQFAAKWRSKGYVRRARLDAFHAKKHKCSKISFGPEHERNAKLRKTDNSQCVEQLWKVANKFAEVRRPARQSPISSIYPPPFHAA